MVLHRLLTLAISSGFAFQAGANKCGVATNMLNGNNIAMSTFCNADFGFWWNWGPDPKGTYTSPCAVQKFVPMVWGFAPNNPGIAAKMNSFTHMMGYNEPDHWGPPVHPGQDVRSSGTFVQNMHCGSDGLAENWQATVNAYLKVNPHGIVVSPAMADAANTASRGDFARCNTAYQDEDYHDVADCTGWLQCFKEKVMQYRCGSTNCWDVIQVIQFHGYYYAAQDLIKHINAWEQAWVEDLAGAGGRSRKTLWLTEFAHAGTTDATDPDGSARAFMEEAVTYMKTSPTVTGWSWFSQPDWGSFTIGSKEPASPTWTSELTDRSSGLLTALGQKYASLCSGLASAARPSVGNLSDSLVI